MSWLDRIKNDIIITCGDGKSYSPSYMRASKEIEWHVSLFDFPGQDGTLVKRNKKIGTKYGLELYFQGEDHLDDSLAFETSANNSGGWKIQHPFYGTLNVQIQGFVIDNSGYNISKWTGVVIETLLETNPQESISPQDDIARQKEDLDEVCAESLTATPALSDITSIKSKQLLNFNKTIPILTIPSEVEEYFNLFNVANSAVNNIITSPLVAMQATLAVISAPANFTMDIKSKITLLQSQYLTFISNILGLSSQAEKQIFQINGSGIVSTMAFAAANPSTGDYTTSKSVYDIADAIVFNWEKFIADLDLIQTDNGGSTSSFIPSHSVLFGLSQLVDTTLVNLFTIALGAKSERIYITEKDTNWILLAHRFYGLDASDQNIVELMSQNNLGLNGILQIKKGTSIVYYV